MFYNREAVLAWDFTEIGKVKREVAPLQQISGFQISKALTFTVIYMLQERLKMGVLWIPGTIPGQEKYPWKNIDLLM